MRTRKRASAVALEPAPSAVLPPWMVKFLVGALLTALVGGGVGWVNHVSAQQAALAEKAAVVEATQNAMKTDIAEIKQDTREIRSLLTKRK